LCVYRAKAQCQQQGCERARDEFENVHVIHSHIKLSAQMFCAQFHA
jgi:hypothetical protein